MSPMRPRSSSASSTSPVAGKKEKTATKPAGGGARDPPKGRSSSFACRVCGKRFPSQQAMAGHCSSHTRSTAAATRITSARQLLPPPPLPVVALTVQLAVLFWRLTPVRLSFLPLPPSQIGHRWPPGSLFPKSSLLSRSPSSSPTTGEPASATVDVTLRLGSGGKRGNEKPLVESLMVPAASLHGHRGEQGREGTRARGMDGCDNGRKKGKAQMDGLDLELRLHR
uniref:C2H2-type domain-containing protein n=1 Tax=Oryza barthii TaxID=65489 RepID=A0A0D3HBD5_9ORYZ